jgi:choloylglycine hydrolase
VVKRLIISIFLVLASAVFYGAASACTSIALVAEDGTVVYGRTMEWGTFGLNFRVAVIPRGYQLRGHTPDGKPGRSWKARYGVVGLDALEKDIITDGMNEKGLEVGVLSLPGFAEFQPYINFDNFCGRNYLWYSIGFLTFKNNIS